MYTTLTRLFSATLTLISSGSLREWKEISICCSEELFLSEESANMDLVSSFCE